MGEEAPAPIEQPAEQDPNMITAVPLTPEQQAAAASQPTVRTEPLVTEVPGAGQSTTPEPAPAQAPIPPMPTAASGSAPETGRPHFDEVAQPSSAVQTAGLSPAQGGPANPNRQRITVVTGAQAPLPEGPNIGVRTGEGVAAGVVAGVAVRVFEHVPAGGIISRFFRHGRH